MIEQVPFGTNSFAENPEPRVACLLLLDTSGSMNGPPIAELNTGLMTCKDALISDSLAAKRAEIAIMTFGGRVQTVCDFTTVAGFNPPALTAEGETPMGEAIRQGLDFLSGRKELYKAHGIAYFRPWVFLITDGAPTDEWKSAADLVKQGDEKSFSFFTIGIEGANFEILKQICTREPLKLKGLRFQDLFLWLSSSLSSISRSTPGETVPLADPTVGPKGWASVSV